LIFHIVMPLVRKRKTLKKHLLAVVCFLTGGFCFFSVGQIWGADAKGLFDTGHFDEARVAFEALLQENPNDPVALYYLGRLTPDGAKSKAYFLQLVNTHTEHDLADDAFFELAEVDFAQGLYLTARKKYRLLLSQYPKTNQAGMAHYRIGLTFLAMNQGDSAVVAFDDTQIFLADEQARNHARLGRLEALLQMGKKADALQEAQVWVTEGLGALDDQVRAFIARIAPEDGAVERVQAIDGFWIQVAAFGSQEGARTLKRRLEDRGYRVDVGEKPNSRLIFVFVGNYTTRDLAERDKKRILDAFKDVRDCKVIER
jgi:outer membrane protein assembly factor BamD (BamD/ComL family)